MESVKTYYGASVEYSGDTPTDTSQEELGLYSLFSGWNNNTKFVNQDLIVKAQFTTEYAPSGDWETMNPTELYALIKTGVLSSESPNNNVIDGRDRFNIVLGRDYSFENVDDEELVSVGNEMTFDGKSDCYDTGIKLFEEDRSFVLAVDYQYTGIRENAVLFGCFENSGFRSRYVNGSPRIYWGSSANSVVADGSNREMLVIRKRAGDTNLYIYASSKAEMDIQTETLAMTISTTHSAPLSFGAGKQADGYIGSYAQGTIYWAKIWYDDLGDDVCRELASWTRNEIVMEAAGAAGVKNSYGYSVFTNYLLANEDGVTGERYANCCFLMENLLDVTQVMNAVGTNAGGWPATYMREWLNHRVYNALPIQWQLLIKKVIVKSMSGGGDSETETELTSSNDYLWIPSIKEMNLKENTDSYFNEADSVFDIFTDNASRIKYFGDTTTATTYLLRTPRTGYTMYFGRVIEDGSLGLSDAKVSRGVCVGFCI